MQVYKEQKQKKNKTKQIIWFMNMEQWVVNTVYDYSTQFGDNTDYYLEQVYGINISYEDIYDYDELREKMYPSVLNEYLLDDLSNEYYDWLETNKEKLGLTEN